MQTSKALVCLAAFTACFLASVSTASHGENQREYKVLASLFRLALNGPDPISVGGHENYHLSAGTGILNEFDDLARNCSGNPEDDIKNMSLKQRTDSPFIGDAETRVRLAGAFKRFSSKIREKGGELQSYLTTFNQTQTTASTSLFKAALGEQAGTAFKVAVGKGTRADEFDIPDGSVTAGSGYDTMCKGAGDPGSSILADLVCLCAKKGSPNKEQVCTKDQMTFTSNAGTGQAHIDARMKDMFKIAIKTTYASNHKSSPEEFMALLAEFKGMLGANVYVDGANGEEDIFGRLFIFGRAAGGTDAPDCTGTAATNSGSNGICVNYKKLLEAGSPIPWVANVEAAVREMLQGRAQLDAIRRVESEMKAVLHAAQATCEAALALGLRGLSSSKVGGATAVDKKVNPEQKDMSSTALSTVPESRSTIRSFPTFLFFACV